MHNAEPIRVAMAKQRITGERLAVLSGLSRPTVSRIVNGKRVMPDTLKAAADALHVPLAELFTQSDGEAARGTNMGVK